MAPFSYFTEQNLQVLHQSKGFRNFFQHINFTAESLTERNWEKAVQGQGKEHAR